MGVPNLDRLILPLGRGATKPRDPCMLLRLDPWNSIDFLLNTTPLLVTSLLGRTWSNIFNLGDFDASFFDDSGLTSTCLSRRQWQGISGFGGKKQHNRHGFTRVRNHVWEMYEAMAVYHHVSCCGPLSFCSVYWYYFDFLTGNFWNALLVFWIKQCQWKMNEISFNLWCKLCWKLFSINVSKSQFPKAWN